MLRKIRGYVSNFWHNKQLPIINNLYLRNKSIKYTHKLLALICVVVLAIGGSLAINFFNVSKATWNNLVTWSDKLDFETNTTSTNNNGTTPAGTTTVMVDTTSAPGQVKLIKPSDVGETVVAGNNATLVVKNDGTLWGSGQDENGKLGNNRVNTDSYVQLLTDVSSLASGQNGSFNMAIKRDGTLWATGINNYGQLGFGDATNRYTWTQNSLSNVKQVAIGSGHSVALKYDGTVWVVGYNTYGQLGLGDNTNRSTWVQITNASIDYTKNGNKKPVQVMSGSYSSFVLLDDGTVWSVGQNNYGQLGINSTTNQNTWSQMKDYLGINLTGIVKISVEGYHVLAMDNSGAMWGVGLNTSYQLGFNNSANQTGFVNVLSGGVTNISAGYYHSLAVKDGTLWVAGSNSSSRGVLGVSGGSRYSWYNTGITNISSIFAGTANSLIRLNDGSVLASGENSYGQLSDGSTLYYSQWQNNVFPAVSNISSVSTGRNPGSQFIIKSDGSLWGWGYNANSELGLGSSVDISAPTKTSLSNVIKVVVGQNSSMALQSDGKVFTTGLNSYGTLGTGDTNTKNAWTQTLTGVTDISLSYYSAMAVKSDGTVWATGMNSSQQFGLGDSNQRNSWTQVPGFPAAGVSAVKVAAGEAHCLILTADGSIWGSGTNGSGQLGRGNATTTTTFTKSTVISNVSNVWASSGFTYAQKTDGTVWVAGTNTNGQLGLGSYTSPIITWTQLTSFTNAKSISLGLYGAFIVSSDNKLYHTGLNYYGESGEGSNYYRNSSFNLVASDVSSASLGYYASSLLKLDGSVSTAGINSWQSLGISMPDEYARYIYFNMANNTRPQNGYYQTGTISGLKINAGTGNVYNWKTVTWNTSALPANTSVKFRTRGASSEAGLSSASWSSYYTQSGSAITTDRSQWLEIEATVYSSDGVSTPVLDDFSINYYSDLVAPANVTSQNVSAYTNNQKTTPITSGVANNYNQPYFEFSGASDEVGGSGIAGYYVYFGTDNTADPVTAGSYQAHSGAIDNAQSFSPAQSLSADNMYYLRIKTIDSAGNISSADTVFDYNFDKTAPTAPTMLTVSPFGWSPQNNFTFNWVAGTDTSGQNQSNLTGYQYKLGGSINDWSGSGGIQVFSISSSNLSIGDIQAYQNGQNSLFIRSVDGAGNFSSPVQINFYFNGDAPSAPTNLTVSPQSSISNSFTFEWDMPNAYNDGIKGYRYSINALPQKNNTTYIDNTQDGHIKIENMQAATLQGLNMLYVVAVDKADQVSYSSDKTASIGFECNTPAPGVPLNIEIFDTSNRDMQKYSATVGWTKPTVDVVGFKQYDIERSDTGEDGSFVSVGSSAGTSFVDTGLSSQLYYYRVITRDNSNNVSDPSSIVSITPTGRYTTPPNIIVQPEVVAKVSTAQISWVTDRESTSFIEFGEDINYGLEQGKQGGSKVTEHLVELAGLKPETVYYFRTGFIDEDGNIGYSTGSTFKTQPAPRIERVSVQDVRLYSAMLTWYTSEPATSDLLYGKNTSYSNEISNVSGGATTVHSVLLNNLDHSSTYHFAIRITDLDNNKVLSDDYTFDTLQYPKVFNIRFQPITDQPTSTFKVSWASNVPTTSVVEYQPEGQKIQEAVKTKLELQHEITITGLMDNTYYLISVIGVDQYGNQAISDRQRIKTSLDTRPPILSEPLIEVSSSGFGSDAKAQMVVSWQTDEPGTSQIEYGLGVTGTNYEMRSQEDSTLTTSHVVVVTGLTPSSSYHIRALSKDASDNKGVSEPSSIITDQARSSILDVIINSIQSSIGWIFNIGK
jgi:alpha-tubulin suppressor-like RCC1 family protein